MCKKTTGIFLMIFISTFSIKLVGQTPIDAQHQFNQILHSSTPQTNPYGIAWFQTVTLENNHIQNNGYIIVDYIRLIEEDISTGTETVLYNENYNGNGSLTINEGGLFKRFPSWFYDSTSMVMSNSRRSGGFLTINVGQQPDKINHFWGQRQLCSIGKRHKIEIRLLISGDIALQAGMDYWTNSTSTLPINDKEAFYSNWYGDSNGQYITIKYPEYGQQSMFDRNDYGFYQNGKFYLSKKLVDFVGGSSVALLCNATGWQPVLMNLNGNFYEYDTGISYYSYQYYSFKINPTSNSFFVPHAIINNLVYQNDAVDNGQSGYNFYSRPQTISSVNAENNDKKIIIYPNPSSTFIYIKSIREIIDFQIYDCIGNKIHTTDKLNISSIDISKYPTGLYFLKLKTFEGETLMKFIKN